MSDPDEPCGIYFIHLHTPKKSFCSQKHAKVHRIYYSVELKWNSPPWVSENWLSGCNSFRPVFCLTQHIICKWIFLGEDLHIYITEFFWASSSANLLNSALKYVNCSRSGETRWRWASVCCWLQKSNIKASFFNFAFVSPTNVDFLFPFHPFHICDIHLLYSRMFAEECVGRVKCVCVCVCVQRCALFDKWDCILQLGGEERFTNREETFGLHRNPQQSQICPEGRRPVAALLWRIGLFMGWII